MGPEILTVAQMRDADAAAIAAGTPGTVLMEAAGRAVADAVMAFGAPVPVVVLCGPGNNGGDGFVAARYLDAAGWPVRVALLGDRARMHGDAAWAAASWDGPVVDGVPGALRGASLIVDALFGAGLSRPLDGDAALLVEAMAGMGLPIIAVDVPSGVDGDTGAVRGVAAPAQVTVSFFRPKPAHYLYPGRGLCGRLILADIGISPSVLDGIRPQVALNGPDLWRHHLPRPMATGHKYDRGHALILGGTIMTGAARLAARACLRLGAGLVTLACEPAAQLTYSLSMAALIVAPVDDQGFRALLDDRRRNSILLGPGAGMGPRLRAAVLAALSSGRCGVLDGDVFSEFAADIDGLRAAGLDQGWVLTPHAGEFTRLFGILPGNRLDQARAAAARAGAVLVLKGADTIIAHPDGRLLINGNAPPELATAGSGDVLSGLILSLLAQGMDSFLAAAAAVWIHGALGLHCGAGLIADDLPEALPVLLGNINKNI